MKMVEHNYSRPNNQYLQLLMKKFGFKRSEQIRSYYV